MTTMTIAEPTFRLTLPVPPSANSLYKRVLNRNGRRPKTEAYAAWITEAGWALAFARGDHALPLKHARLELDMPLTYKRDISNGIKAIEDLLVSHGVLVDDRYVDELRVRRVPVGEPLVVSLWPIRHA